MNQLLRVLLIEDSDSDAKLIAHVLRRKEQQLEIKRVDNEAALRDALLSGHYDLVLSDWTLPGFGAEAALEIVKALQLDVPFIIVSGTVGEEQAVAAMRAGAHDYVLKDRLARLAPVIERELRERDARAEA